MEMRKRIPGLEHPDTLAKMRILTFDVFEATPVRRSGDAISARMEEAEKMYSTCRELEGSEKIGDDVDMVNNLQKLHRQRASWQKRRR